MRRSVRLMWLCTWVNRAQDVVARSKRMFEKSCQCQVHRMWYRLHPAVRKLNCLATPDPIRAHGRPSVQECRLRLKRPAPNAARRCPPFKSSTAFPRSCSCGLFPWVASYASLSAKKYGTPYFSARKRTSKYSRSCSQSLAELLRL